MNTHSSTKAYRSMPLTLSECAGVRYLHFGTEWIQGAMNLRQPDRLVLEYAQQMMIWTLFLDAPQHIVQLGLGAASLTKFCYRYFPQARVTAVEIDPDVIQLTRSMFKLPANDERLQVVCQDAAEFVNDPEHHATCNVLQVDLYDASARGPVLDSYQFYSACRACLTSPGIMTVNLFGDHPSFARNLRALKEVFEQVFPQRVLALPQVHEGNRVILTFQGPPFSVAWSVLKQRAQLVQALYRLPAKAWLRSLEKVATRHTQAFSI